MLSRVPKDIPLFLGLTAGLSVAAYGFTPVWIAERPSSTAALAYIFIPLWSVIVAVFAFLLGALVRELLRRFSGKPAQFESLWLLPSLLALCVLAASGFGAARSREKERAAMPGILVNTGNLERASSPKDLSETRPGKLLREGLSKPELYAWEERVLEFTDSKLGLRIRDTATGKVIDISTDALSYVSSVHVAPVVFTKSSRPSLAIVVTGRPTGHRALVLVISAQFELTWEERIERFWPTNENPIAIARGSNDSELAIVGANCSRAYALRERNAQ